MPETTEIVNCTNCGTQITTPFCPTCGKDHRALFPELALVAFHRRKVINAHANLKLARTTAQMPKKKLDRIEGRFDQARGLFIAVGSLLKEVGRACPIPDCCKEQ